jgi:hypothetical protein
MGGLLWSGAIMLRIERQGQRVLAWMALCAMLALVLWCSEQCNDRPAPGAL